MNATKTTIKRGKPVQVISDQHGTWCMGTDGRGCGSGVSTTGNAFHCCDCSGLDSRYYFRCAEVLGAQLVLCSECETQHRRDDRRCPIVNGEV